MAGLLSCRALKCYREHWNGSEPAQIDDITASFDAGTLSVLTGPGNSSKRLLLSLLGLLETPDSGSIHLEGCNVTELPGPEIRRIRNECFGFLFDTPCLLPSFSLAENIAMPLFRICGTEPATALERVRLVLALCGIEHHENTLAARLNASEQNLAALARALVHEPKVLIALFPRSASEIMEVVARAARERELCALWASRENDPVIQGARALLITKRGLDAAPWA